MLNVYQATKSDFTIFQRKRKNKYFPEDTWIISHVSFEHLILYIFFPSQLSYSQEKKEKYIMR